MLFLAYLLTELNIPELGPLHSSIIVMYRPPLFFHSKVTQSVAFAFGHELAAVVLLDPLLQLPDAFEGQFAVLVAFNLFLGVPAHMEVDLGVLFFVDLQFVVQVLHHLLFHLVEQNCRILRERFRERWCLE